ncbi:MAG: tetratricopeptide repeat protein [Brevinemataceae bacterium]
MKKQLLIPLLTLCLGLFLGIMMGLMMDPLDRAIHKASRLNHAGSKITAFENLQSQKFNFSNIFNKQTSNAQYIQDFSTSSRNISKKLEAVNSLKEIKEFTALAKQEVLIDKSLQKYLLSLGKQQFENNMLHEASQSFEQAYKLNQTDLSATQWTAVSYLKKACSLSDKKEQLTAAKKAAEYFHIALGLDPNNIDSLYGLGIINMYLENDNESVSEFEKVLRLQPEHTGAMIKLGNIYFSQNKFAQSEKLFLQAEALLLEAKSAKQTKTFESSDYINKNLETISQYLKMINLIKK